LPNPVAWFEIIGKDTNRLRTFYGEVFAWKLAPPVPEMGNYSLLDNEGRGIGGGIGEGEDRVTIYIEVDDPQAYLDKVERAGGKTLMPVMAVNEGVTIAMFADPEDHVIGLLKANPT
jgi:predicted enzyme related to lactoylglutathione lyase